MSIVILNFNGLLYLQRIIPALIALDFNDYEIVVLENGSTDGSTMYLKSFKQIHIINQTTNLGYSRGKNSAIENAAGDYILLLDNDILIEDKDILQKLLVDYRENELLTITLLNEGETRTKYYGSYPSFYGLRENKPIDIKRILQYKGDIRPFGANGGALFFKKNLWHLLGGYDENQPFNLDDFDLGPRAWLRGFTLRIFNKTYFLHIGSRNREDPKVYLWQYRFYFSGISRMMVKNYRWVNIVIRYPFFVGFILIKTAKRALQYKSLGPFTTLLFSIRLFIINLPSTLKARRQIQKSRRVRNDIFLKIRPVF
ncbi:MAG: glycosyltransferase family 2 protein [bacterium]